MQQPNKITEYLEVVGQQIRWKKAHSPVLEEINNHIIDQKNAFVNDGLNEEEATDKAIAEMGDPIVAGEQLDRTHIPRPDWPLFVMTAAMLLLGLTIQILIGPNHLNNGAEMFQKQIIWAGIAILVMFAAYFLDFTIIGKYPKVVFFALSFITVANYYFFTIFTGIGNNSLTTIYPMLLFPTAFAGFVYSMRNKGYGGFILCGAALIVPACLSMLMQNLTVLFLICISFLIILTVAVAKEWFNVSKLRALLILYISSAVVIFTIFFMNMGQWYAGITWLDPTRVGYIGTFIQQSLFNSRLIGEGLPLNGYGQYPWGSTANTDFILTYLIYRFGWIFSIGILAIFSAFIVRAIIVCKKQNSVLGLLVSLAIISTFAIQYITFIAANLGLLLFAPVSLPLLSYGGRALVTNMFLIGFLLSVFRTGNLARDNVGVAATKSRRLIQYDNGKIIIDLKGHFFIK